MCKYAKHNHNLNINYIVYCSYIFKKNFVLNKQHFLSEKQKIYIYVQITMDKIRFTSMSNSIEFSIFDVEFPRREVNASNARETARIRLSNLYKRSPISQFHFAFRCTMAQANPQLQTRHIFLSFLPTIIVVTLCIFPLQHHQSSTVLFRLYQ